MKNLMNSLYIGIVSAVTIPILNQLAVDANVTGITRTVLLLIPTFVILGVLFQVLSGFKHSAK
jgi:hypothetical protein